MPAICVCASASALWTAASPLRRATSHHVLYGRHHGRRLAVYVPEELVGEVRRFIENGRALQDLLMQAGPCYVKALKRARKGTGNRNQGSMAPAKAGIWPCLLMTSSGHAQVSLGTAD